MWDSLFSYMDIAYVEHRFFRKRYFLISYNMKNKNKNEKLFKI